MSCQLMNIYFIFVQIGNQTTNKDLKSQRKKQKKATKRTEKKVNDVADVLENFTLDMMDDAEDKPYDFKVDFTD